MSPQFALITVTFNSADDLRANWRDMATCDVPWIVADNASSDDSLELAREFGAQEVVALDRNRGFSVANNAAVCAFSAQCYIFVNPDVRVDRDGAGLLAAYALEHQVLAAPQLLNADGSRQENGRRLPYLYRKIAHLLGLAASRDSYEVFAEPGEIVTVDWVMGAALAVPAQILEALGGWDSGFFIYYEDSDLCLRASRLGYKTQLVGSVRWTHGWGRATKSYRSLKAWRYEFLSAGRFYRRYPSLLLHPRIVRPR